MKDVIERYHFARSSTTDLNKLAPGDVILFEAISPATHVVSRIQSVAGYEGTSANIVHAALYLDHGTLCHAQPMLWMKPTGGICIQLAWNVITNPKRSVYVLRARGISDIQRRDIALYAATKTRSDSHYDWGGVFDAIHHYLSDKITGKLEGKRSIKNIMKDLPKSLYTALGNERSDPKIQEIHQIRQLDTSNTDFNVNEAIGGAVGFVCSDFVSHSYNFILGVESPFAALQEIKTPIYSPADIFLNEAFSCVSGAQVDRVYDVSQAAN